MARQSTQVYGFLSVLTESPSLSINPDQNFQHWSHNSFGHWNVYYMYTYNLGEINIFEID